MWSSPAPALVVGSSRRLRPTAVIAAQERLAQHELLDLARAGQRPLRRPRSSAPASSAATGVRGSGRRARRRRAARRRAARRKQATISPQFSSGTPTTATSATSGCSSRTFSISAGNRFSPPRMIISFTRPVIRTVAARVHRAEVAGVQPAVGVDRRGGGLGIVVVAEHDAVAARADLADSPTGTTASVCGVADRDLGLRQRLADRLAQIVDRVVGAATG